MSHFHDSDLASEQGDASDVSLNDVLQDDASADNDVDDDDLSLEDVERICCIGAGRVGILSMAVLSRYWPDKVFVVLDKNEDIINSINGNPRELYFWEPGVDELLDEAMQVKQNLIFSSNIAAELDNCRIIFVAVDIPLKTQPRQVKNDLEIQNLEDAIVAILNSIQRAPDLPLKYVAIKSTLPIDYKLDIRQRFSGYPNFRLLRITTNPEFFSVGTAVDDLLYPHKIVLGNFFQDGQHLFRNLYRPVVDNDDNRIEMIDTVSSAELGKLLSNASIAAQLTVMNITSTICEKVNSNFHDVKRSYTANPRVDAFFTDSRAGYGGLGLNKDVSYLAFLCDNVGLRGEMEFFNKLIKIRKKKMDDLVKTILSKVGSSKNVTIYGFSNKVDTDDIRESPAIYICRALLHAHDVRLMIYDPVVPDQNIISSFPDRDKNRVVVVANAQAAAVHAQALVFLVEWPEFSTILQQPQQLLNAMRSPRVIFDCCDLIDNTVGFHGVQGATVYRLGKPI